MIGASIGYGEEGSGISLKYDYDQALTGYR
jgi:hypothetical protein